MTATEAPAGHASGHAGVQRAVVELALGRPVVVVDGADREDEGDLVIAASLATEQWVAFMIRHTSGVLCVPMEGRDLDRLALPPMTAVNEDPKGTAYTVSVDARHGVTTGISAADRARTIRALADPATVASDLTRPGHVFPLRAVPGGVLSRPGHTEAAVDLARLAGLPRAAVIAEVVRDDGPVGRLPYLRRLADEHGLALVTISDLIASRALAERVVRRIADTRLPTAHGTFRAVGYLDVAGSEHVALVAGDVAGREDVLVRLHSECATGDVFRSLRCDCGPQLSSALDAVAAEGRGVVVYLRGHEGRGIGLVQKLMAYEHQDSGSDTVDANLELGLPADARDYAAGAGILQHLGVRSVRLITNNPEKRAAIERHGVVVRSLVAQPVQVHAENLRYLHTKRDRMGHLLPELPALPVVGWDAAVEGRST